MRNTFWFAVDYDGTGHLFTYKPERDTGIWIGKEALHIPQGAFKVMFPGITWQDIPRAVTLEVLPRQEKFRISLSKSCRHRFRISIRIPMKGEQ